MDHANQYDTAILDLLSDGVIAVDPALKLLRLNRAACRILGVSEAAALGQSVMPLMDVTGFLRLLDGQETYFDSINFGKDLKFSRVFSCGKDRSVLVCVLREEPSVSEQDEDLLPAWQQAEALADTISEKQLAIVHEIAGLMGESAVETQRLVRDLKQALRPVKGERHG